MANTSLYFGSAFGGSGGGGSVPSGWTWTATALTGPSGSSIETDSATFGGVTVTEGAGSGISLLDLHAANDAAVYWFRMWNAAFTADPTHGLTAYQTDAGEILIQAAPDGSGGWMSFGTGFSAIFVIDDIAYTPSGNVYGTNAGIWLDAHHGAIRLSLDQGISTPPTPTVTNVGTPGVSTVTYKIVGKNSQGTFSFHTAASAAGTTTTANGTLNGSNFNRLSNYWPKGAFTVDIYRTAGGATQGLIASDVVAETFDDTGLPGGGETPPATDDSAVIFIGRGDANNRILSDATEFTIKGTVTGTVLQPTTGYKSVDGTAGATAGPFTVITGITVKNGLVTALTGS